MSINGARTAHALFQPAEPHRANEGNMRKAMKREYDFRKAKRGPVVAPARGKTRITIRIDDNVLAWFRDVVERAGSGPAYRPHRNGYLLPVSPSYPL